MVWTQVTLASMFSPTQRVVIDTCVGHRLVTDVGRLPRARDCISLLLPALYATAATCIGQYRNIVTLSGYSLAHVGGCSQLMWMVTHSSCGGLQSKLT